MDDSTSSPQKELQLSDGSTTGPVTLETLQKQVHELRAKLKSLTQSAYEETASLQEQYVYQRKLLTGALCAMLLLVGGLCLFIGTQMQTVRSQLATQSPALIKQLNEYDSRLEPNIKNFASQLQGFAASHPDFRPVLERYRRSLPRYFSSVVPTLPDTSSLPSTNAPPQ